MFVGAWGATQGWAITTWRGEVLPQHDVVSYHRRGSLLRVWPWVCPKADGTLAFTTRGMNFLGAVSSV